MRFLNWFNTLSYTQRSWFINTKLCFACFTSNNKKNVMDVSSNWTAYIVKTRYSFAIYAVHLRLGYWCLMQRCLWWYFSHVIFFPTAIPLPYPDHKLIFFPNSLDKLPPQEELYTPLKTKKDWFFFLKIYSVSYECTI